MINIFKNLTKLLAAAALFSVVASPATAAPSSKIKLQDLAFVPVVSTDTLQSGTTFYVSSGTVNQELNILGQLKFSDGTLLTSTNAIAGYLLSSTNTWTAPNTFLQIVTANITGNAGTVTNGAYINIDNNWAQTQKFQYGILVETATVNGDLTANTLLGSTMTITGQANFNDVYGSTSTFLLTNASTSNVSNLGIWDAALAYKTMFRGGAQTADITYTLPASTDAAKCLKTGVDGVTLEWGDCGGAMTNVAYTNVNNNFTTDQTVYGKVLITSATMVSNGITSSYDSYTKSVLHLDGSLTDDTGKTWSGSPSYDASGKFSQALQGNGSAITTSDTLTDFDCTGTGECTIDFWYKEASGVGFGADIFSLNNSNKWFIYSGGEGSGISSICVGRSGLWSECTDPGTLTTGVWSHIAVVVHSGSTKVYIDGQLEKTIAHNIEAPGASISLMGISLGSVDELRFSKDAARWLTGFVPPTAPYTPNEPIVDPRAGLDILYITGDLPYVLAVSTSPDAYMLTVSSSTGEVAIANDLNVEGSADIGGSLTVTGDVSADSASVSTLTVRGKTDFGAKTHAELQLLACPTLPCIAMSSDAPYHLYIATDTPAGSWQDEAGAAP